MLAAGGAAVCTCVAHVRRLLWDDYAKDVLCAAGPIGRPSSQLTGRARQVRPWLTDVRVTASRQPDRFFWGRALGAGLLVLSRPADRHTRNAIGECCDNSERAEDVTGRFVFQFWGCNYNGRYAGAWLYNICARLKKLCELSVA